MNDILSKDLIKDWGLESLPEKKRFEIMDRLGTMLYQAILVRSLDFLSDKEEDELDGILDKDATTVQDVMLFLRTKIPTLELLIKDEMRKLREDLYMPVS